MQRPAEAFSRIRADGDYVQPLLYAGLVMMAMTLFNILFSILWGTVFSGSSGLGALAVAGGLGLAAGMFAMVIAPIVIVIALFLMAGIFHGILSATGGLDRSRAGFEGSFKVVAYASIASVLGIIPIVGPLLNLAALGYLCYIGLPRVHGCSDRQALYALIPLMLCGGCGVLGMIAQTMMSVF